VNTLQDWLGRRPARVALLLYFSVGFIQLLIIPAGLAVWLELHWMWAVVVAAVLAWIPLAGQALGLAAAAGPLNWPLAAALALFLWPIWLVAAALVARRLGGGKAETGRHRQGTDAFDRGFDALRKRRAHSRTDTDDPSPHMTKAA
jgi:hypothetical protein